MSVRSKVRSKLIKDKHNLLGTLTGGRVNYMFGISCNQNITRARRLMSQYSERFLPAQDYQFANVRAKEIKPL